MEPFRLSSGRRLGPVANVEANADRDADLQHLQLFYHKTAARERGETYVCREESFPHFAAGVAQSQASTQSRAAAASACEARRGVGGDNGEAGARA
jgi:hypothetical protein